MLTTNTPERTPDFIAEIYVNSHVVKKNNRPIFKSRRGGVPFIGKNPDLVRAEALMHNEIVRQRLKQKIHYPLTGYIHANFLFYFPPNVFYTKKGDRSKKVPDLSNLYELPQDALQQAGVIENDTQIDSHDGSRRLPGPNYKLIIRLWRIDEA